jgi:hypothetical protein
MAFNISGFFQNMVNPSVNENTAAEIPQAALPSANISQTIMSSLMEGDTLNAYVTGIKNGMAQLQLSSGENILARLATDAQLQLGRNMTFLVQSNTGSLLSLKVLEPTEQQSVMVQKALEAAGLVPTDSNVSVVEKLLQWNMSIDTNTINEMIKNNLKFPNENPDTIANLMKMQIPVTEGNIQQYTAYTHYEHNMSEQINSIPYNLAESVVQLMDSDSSGDAPKLLNDVVQALYNDLPEEVSTEAVNVLSEDETTQLFQGLREAFGTQAEPLVEQIKNGLSTKDTILQIAQLSEQTQNSQQVVSDSQHNSAIKQLISSNEMVQLINAGIQETMYLKPQTAGSEEGIKGFYSRVRKNLDQALESVNKDAPESTLAKNMNEVKSNIDFMNDMNHNMMYFQMPVKFSESTGNGEMYVFTNKKSLQQHPDKVSALLHLDMENLGALDVYVQLSGKSVTTNFCLEDEETLDFVYEHIDMLNERLEALGYQPHFEMKVIQPEEKFDFVKKVVKQEKNDASAVQYIFDRKV